MDKLGCVMQRNIANNLKKMVFTLVKFSPSQRGDLLVRRMVFSYTYPLCQKDDDD